MRAAAAAIIQRKWTSSMSASTPIASTSQPQTAMFTKMALIQPYDGVSSPVTPHFRGNLLASAPISNFRHNVLFVFCFMTHFMTESLLSPHANIILPSVVELICLYLVISHNFQSLKTVRMQKKSKEYYLRPSALSVGMTQNHE